MYVERNNITEVRFTGDMRDTSRVKLYDRMAPKMIPGWMATATEEDGEKYYTLTSPKRTKFNPAEWD